MEQMSKQKLPEGNFVVIFDNVAAACQNYLNVQEIQGVSRI